MAPNGDQGEGLDGIDNALGKLVVANMTPEFGTISGQSRDALAAGNWTLQIVVTGLSDDPQQTSTGLSLRLFNSGQYPDISPPSFDETTDWPALGSGNTFDDVVVANGVVTARSSTPTHVKLRDEGATLPLVLHDAIVTFVHTSDGAMNGTIAGVLDLEEFTAQMRQQAGRISPQLCGSAFDGIAAQYARAADILKDGSNRAGVPCDGISVGFGFNAKLVANPTVLVRDPPLPDACP
jgi:hypothetical protein